MSNQYLERTPTSTGNRSIWTWAGWTKVTDVANTNSILGAYYGSSSRYSLLRLTSNKLTFFGGLFTTGSSTSYNAWVDTIQSIRDAGGWMHIMVVYNTTNAVSDERVKIYLNGVNVHLNRTASPGWNTATYINSKYPHYIGTWADSSNNGSSYYDGELSDLFLVDGLALTPDVFGFNKDGNGYISVGSTQITDFRPGQWMPHSPRKIKSEIERRGGFGSNGYYLPMNDSSNFGADFHTTPNSVIKLKGEDLSQPQNGAPTTSDAFVSQVRKEAGSLGFDGVVAFDGTGDSLQTTAASCWSASSDCTFECFIYPTTFSVQQGIFHTGANGDFSLLTDGRLRVHPVGSNWKDTKGAIPLHAWSHIALVQSSSNQRKVFINGVEQAFTSSGSPDSSGWHNPDGGVYIGDDGVYRNFFNGFMSNVRVIKGTALYTANFTPPTKPLTNVTNTKLLCCNSLTSATASTVTPGTITANGDPFATKSELTGSTELAVAGISTATGSNLVTNGTFDTNTTGWTSEASATLSTDNGRLKVLTTNTNYGSANQTVTGLTVGKRYTFQVDMIYGNAALVTVLTGATGSQLISGWQSADYVWRTSFTATTTSLLIDFQMASQNGVYGLWDNVILKEEDLPKDYSADIKDSGTNRTPSAIGPMGVGYDIPSHYGSAINTTNASDALYYNVDASGTANGYGTGDFTFECWFYGNSEPSTWGILMQHATNGTWASGITLCSKWGTARQFNIYTHDGSSNVQTLSPNTWTLNQWHHVVAERHNGQLTLYVNGVAEATRADTRTYNVAGTPASSAQYGVSIGSQSEGSYQSNGYFQDVRVYKGVAKYKGGFDVNKPYTPVNFASWRAVPDNSKNNFCIINSNASNGKYGLAEGNLSFTATTANWTGFMQGTLGFSTGKWYWETRADVDTNYHHLGIIGATNNHHDIANTYVYAMSYQSDGRFYGENNNTSPFANGKTNLNDGDIFQIAVDMDNKKMWFGVNGNWIDSGNPSAGTGENYNSTVGFAYEHYLPFYDSYSTAGLTANFGQNPTFGGHRTAGTNTDDNGRGLFAYDVPTGFLALCDDNFPAPAIPDPGKHMKTVLYTGDGSDGRSIGGVGFKPDLVWVKSRTSTVQHYFVDVIRGEGNALASNSTAAETSSTTWLRSFDSNGFSIGGSSGWNGSGNNYVAWCWKAGGPAVSNYDGSITTQVSANRTAGFSIVTGTMTSGTDTLGHGLDKAPQIIITKQTNGTTGWYTYAKRVGSDRTLRLDQDSGSTTFSHWVTHPTDSVFSMGSGFGSGEAYVAYCWHGVEGFSKTGLYKGNADGDGTFVYCGFRPAWVMIKNADQNGTYWTIFDSSRKSTNPANHTLNPNLDHVEETAGGNGQIDFLSSGFKCRNTDGGINGSGVNYVFLAFAESPFQTANAK